MSLAAAAQEVIWLKQILSSLKIFQKTTVKLYQDNQGAITIAMNPISHQRTKRIDV
jgi:hypothetical protein